MSLEGFVLSWAMKCQKHRQAHTIIAEVEGFVLSWAMKCRKHCQAPTIITTF